jgi:hypothetical protein
MSCKHEWKEGKRTLAGTPVRECKKCGRIEYLVKPITGGPSRWKLTPY